MTEKLWYNTDIENKTKVKFKMNISALVVELVDTPDLKSDATATGVPVRFRSEAPNLKVFEKEF